MSEFPGSLHVVAALRTALADRYDVEREIGRGGMATIYLARDLRHERPVLIKVLRAPAFGAERLLAEIRTTANLQHPRIIPVQDTGIVAGRPYYVTPSIDGETLRARLERDKQLPIADALRIASEVAAALDHAHRHGIIHRDIKPENILLNDGSALVGDFGIGPAAQGTDAERVAKAGTPSYTSPEQATGDRTVDARTDVYALGCVLYEMLVGTSPFTGSAQTVGAKVSTEPPRRVREQRPEVPLNLDAAVHRALQREPVDRFATIAKFADALSASAPAAVVAPSTTAAPSAPSTPRPTKAALTVPRNRRALIASVAGGAALIAVIAWASHKFGGRTAAAAQKSDASVLSVAVLPFANQGPDTSATYFAEGLSEELLNALAEVPDLTVAARTSSWAFKNSRDGVRSAAEFLGVASVVEGSVRRQDGRVRVTAQLIKAADGSRLWSHTYESSAADVFAIQDTLARAIAAALRVTPQGGRRAGMTSDPAAYDLYLQARDRRARPSPENIRASIGLYEQAVQRDSTFALAFAGLSDVLLSAPLFDPTQPAGETMARSREFMKRASALSPTSGEVAASAARQAWAEWDFPRAKLLIDSAVQRAPSSYLGHNIRREILISLGDAYGAAEEARRALELDPVSASAAYNRFVTLRDVDSASVAGAYLDRAAESTAGPWYWLMSIGGEYAAMGRREESIQAYRRLAVRLGYAHPERMDVFADSLPDAVRLKARGALVDDIAATTGIPKSALVLLYARGDGDAFFAAANETVVGHGAWAPYLGTPWVATMHSTDRRYPLLLRKIGLGPANGPRAATNDSSPVRPVVAHRARASRSRRK